MIDELNTRLKALFRQTFLANLRHSDVVGEYEFQLFKWYLRETEELTQKMTAEEVAYVNEQNDAGDPEPNDTGLVAAEYYMRRVRYSHVIYLASLFENMLKGECDRLAYAIGETGLLFTLGELKGETWVVKRRFLERYGRFKIPVEIWQPAQDLLNVRNIIVHENGTVSTPPSDKVASIAKLPGISIVAGEIQVSGDYVGDAAIAIEKLSTFVANEVSGIVESALMFQGKR